MLVLSRKVGEEIIIDGNIRIRIIKVDGNKVRIGITAPDNISVDAGRSMTASSNGLLRLSNH